MPAVKKDAVRKRIRAKLRQLDPDQRALASLFICQLAAHLPAFRSAKTVGLFLSLPTEPDLAPLIEEAWSAKKQIVLPRILPSDDNVPALDWYAIPPSDSIEDALLRNPDNPNLLEPDPKLCAPIPLTEIDCLFVPALALDPAGWRLGRGGGYYDHTLAQIKSAIKPIPHPALLFELQLVPELPREPHDQRLDCAISEDGLHLFPS